MSVRYFSKSARLLAAALSLGLAVALAGGCSSQATPQKSEGSKPADKYPNKNITLVVPFGPGGSTDTLARSLAPALQKQLGVTVVVENMPGAGAQVGFTNVFQAKPDGYTLVVVDQPTMQIGEVGGAKYKTQEFTKIYGLTVRSHGFAVRYDDKAATLDDFIKQYQGKTVNASCAGLGTAGELQLRLAAKSMKTDFKAIPFAGAAEQLSALLGSQTQAAFASLENCIPLHKDKKIKILAVLLDERHPLIPDVPTLKELGHPDGYVVASTGIMGPAGMTPEMVKTLEEALGKAVKDATFEEWLKNSGTQLKSLSARDYDQATQNTAKKIDQYADLFKKKS